MTIGDVIRTLWDIPLWMPATIILCIGGLAFLYGFISAGGFSDLSWEIRGWLHRRRVAKKNRELE